MSSIDDGYAMARHGAADPKPKLSDMIQALDHESIRMAGSQRALVASALRSDYDGDEMRRIACLEEAMDLLGRIRAHVVDWPEDVQAVIKGIPIATKGKGRGK